MTAMNDKPYRGYLYPFTGRDGGMKNPYINYFIRSLEGRIEIVNRHHPSNSGILDILKYIHKIDLLFLNWPEEILEKKGGVLQMVFYFFLLHYLKLRKVRIFWTFHNKTSHLKNHTWLKNKARDFTARKSDFILTHARDGVSIVEDLSRPRKPKIFFLHHPVLPAIQLTEPERKKFDILIWGMVAPYKGIDQFLRFIRDEKMDHLKILVAGKISGTAYREVILYYQSDQVEIIDAFISMEQLEEFIAQSKAVLFTYLEYSILSSGALMDTLRYMPRIIGPNYGAFRDLYDEGLIGVYRDYAHLKTLLENSENRPDKVKMQKFIQDHSWDEFGIAVYNFIKQNLTTDHA